MGQGVRGAGRAEDAVKRALDAYLLHAGSGILGILRASGQARVKIAVSALYRFHDPSTGYARLDDAIRELGGVLASVDGKLVRYRGRLYIEIPVSYIEELLG